MLFVCTTWRFSHDTQLFTESTLSGSVKTIFLISGVFSCLPTGRVIDQCCSFKNKKHLALPLTAQIFVSSYVCMLLNPLYPSAFTPSIYVELLFFVSFFKTILVQTVSFRHLVIILWFSGFSEQDRVFVSFIPLSWNALCKNKTAPRYPLYSKRCVSCRGYLIGIGASMSPHLCLLWPETAQTPAERCPGSK